MPASHLDEILSRIRDHGEEADLRRQLDWLDAIAAGLLDAGSRFPQHNAYHPGATDDLRGELDRLQAGPVGGFLRHSLARRLGRLPASADPRAAETLLVNSSFVLSTLVDLLQNPEHPFEITALLFESQAMFDEWYDQLLAMSGLADPV